MFILSKKSKERLIGVDTSLVKVVHRALELSKIDFGVLEGVRSTEQCYVNFGKGRTKKECIAGGCPSSYSNTKVPKITWLKSALGSKHHGGKAVDLIPYPLDWMDIKSFDMIAVAMIAASKELGVKIRCGRDFKSVDSPHFELV